MVPKFYVGVDISKLTLDVALITKSGHATSFKIANTETAFKNFLADLKLEYGFKSREIIFCAEHMGIYATFLLSVLAKKKINIYLESPLQIKRSLGIQRGKNDKVDAIRIAQYLIKHYKIMRFWQPPRDCVEQLKVLFTIRKKLIKVNKTLTNSEKTNTYFLTRIKKKQNETYYLQCLNAIISDIKHTEKSNDGTYKIR